MGYLVPALLAFFAVIRIWDFAKEDLGARPLASWGMPASTWSWVPSP